MQASFVAIPLSWTGVAQHMCAVGGDWVPAICREVLVLVLVVPPKRSLGALDSHMVPPGCVPRLEVDIHDNADHTARSSWDL